jgi:putative flippase GtrA
MPSTRQQIVRFAIAGVVGLVVDAGLLYLALHLGIGYFVGRGISFIAAVWSTWQINRQFTFSASAHTSAWREWWQYLLAMAVGGIFNYAAYSAVIVSFHKSALLPLFAVGVGGMAGMIINFLSAKLWVFKKPH